jgi:translation initiation factor 3 subunit G
VRSNDLIQYRPQTCRTQLGTACPFADFARLTPGPLLHKGGESPRWRFREGEKRTNWLIAFFLCRDWADDDDLDETTQAELPPPQTIQNKDGTKTTITYRYNEDGQKVKTTRRIRLVTHREVVNPRVAERKTWGKFGLSANDKQGPQSDTTSVGENIIFRLSTNWKKDTKDEAKDAQANAMKDKLKDKTVKCRICNGEHFTARCPYKDTMAPVGAEGAADPAAGMGDEPAPSSAGGLGAKKGSYVPPALRNGGGAAGAGGERMGGKFGERDDFATLRVTNVGFPPPIQDPSSFSLGRIVIIAS